MNTPTVSQGKANVLFLVALVVGTVLLAYLRTWWPAALLVVGGAMMIKQFLTGRLLDMLFSIIACGGLFITLSFNINWAVVMPVLLISGTVALLYREFSLARGR